MPPPDASIPRRVVRRLKRRSHISNPPGFITLTPEHILQVVFETVLQREPDEHAKKNFLLDIQTGGVTGPLLAQRLMASGEFWSYTKFTEIMPSLHMSRTMFVKSLPPAKRILDLGGTALSPKRDGPDQRTTASQGAMVLMGYPYEFDRLTIVDLPMDERETGYLARGETPPEIVNTHLGPVEYRYHSMTDLSAFADGSFDLVYSGQTIEHVTLDEADQVLAEVRRVLRPGGWLALDTPNARITRLHQAEFIDADHKHEYTHAEMLAKFAAAGLVVTESKGLNYAGQCVASGTFDEHLVATQRGMYFDIEDCYLLAYLCVAP